MGIRDTASSFTSKVLTTASEGAQYCKHAAAKAGDAILGATASVKNAARDRHSKSKYGRFGDSKETGLGLRRWEEEEHRL